MIRAAEVLATSACALACLLRIHMNAKASRIPPTKPAIPSNKL
jgi:hypothetical protein